MRTREERSAAKTKYIEAFRRAYGFAPKMCEMELLGDGRVKVRDYIYTIHDGGTCIVREKQ